MKTSQQMLEDMLLKGMHVNKFLFYERTGTVCLAQRILDIRQTKGWFIRSKSIPGKGSLREYWLDKDEIARIGNEDVTNSLRTDDEPVTNTERTVNEDVTEQTSTNTILYEQSSLGLFGENKYV